MLLSLHFWELSMSITAKADIGPESGHGQNAVQNLSWGYMRLKEKNREGGSGVWFQEKANEIHS